MGYLEELKQESNFRGEITDCFLDNNYFCIKVNGQNLKVTGDLI